MIGSDPISVSSMKALGAKNATPHEVEGSLATGSAPEPTVFFFTLYGSMMADVVSIGLL